MGIPLVLGRGFGSQDTSQSQKVAVISETFAERFFPRRSPLGQRFGRTPETAEQFEIIGVVKDAKYGDLTEQSRPMVYYFYGQQGENLSNFVVRYSGPPQSIVSQVRQAIREVNRNLPIDEVVSLSEQIGRSLARQKVVARLASFFGGLALLLASVGLYGILSYAVARRTNEIGIRMALGATHRDVLWLILREALTLVTGGVVIGLAGSLAATRLAAGLLFNLQPNDPLTIMLAALLLIIVALMASCIPARQATKVDPMQALRSQ
jgi:predicted permease